MSSGLIEAILPTGAGRGVTGATTVSGAFSGAIAASCGTSASGGVAAKAAVRTDLVVAGSGAVSAAAGAGALVSALAPGLAPLDGTSLTAKVFTLTGLIGASLAPGMAAVVASGAACAATGAGFAGAL